MMPARHVMSLFGRKLCAVRSAAAVEEAGCCYAGRQCPLFALARRNQPKPAAAHPARNDASSSAGWQRCARAAARTTSRPPPATRGRRTRTTPRRACATRSAESTPSHPRGRPAMMHAVQQQVPPPPRGTAASSSSPPASPLARAHAASAAHRPGAGQPWRPAAPAAGWPERHRRPRGSGCAARWRRRAGRRGRPQHGDVQVTGLTANRAGERVQYLSERPLVPGSCLADSARATRLRGRRRAGGGAGLALHSNQ